jgi:hypothetical protein
VGPWATIIAGLVSVVAVSLVLLILKKTREWFMKIMKYLRSKMVWNGTIRSITIGYLKVTVASIAIFNFFESDSDPSIREAIQNHVTKSILLLSMIFLPLISFVSLRSKRD